MGEKKIAVFIGSLRKEAFSRKIAKALMNLAPDSLQLEIVEIASLPLYNQDFDDNSPDTYTQFRQLLKKFDGLLFVTPEHNRSIPAALKNALDVGSRPYGKNKWNVLPAAVVSLSVGAIGGFGANQHLRQMLSCLNVAVMPQPEAYLGNIADLLDEKGNLADNSTREFLARFMQAFAAWVALHAPKAAKEP